MKSELFLRPEERDLFPPQSLLRYEAPLLRFCPLNGLPASSPARGTLGSSRRPARLLTSLRVEAQDSKEEAAGVNQVQAQNEHPPAPPLLPGPFDPSGPAPARPGPAPPRRHLHHEDDQ